MTKSSKRELSSEQKKINEPMGTSDFESLYLKKDYKAAAQYLLNNKQQLKSGIFHYNLGTVYSKMGDQATARYHLEKAIKEGYINSASLNNLSFVKSQLNIDDLSTSTSLPDQFINAALNVPNQAYYSMSLILILVSLVLFKTKTITSKWVMALALLLSLMPATFLLTYVNQVNYAVTLKEIPLYEGPSKIFAEKGKIRPGSKVILGDYREGWFFVEFPLSLAGWVNKDQLGLY